MATSGVDRKLKIWDLRTYKELHSYKLGAGPGHLAFSQRGLLAAGIGSVVEVIIYSQSLFMQTRVKIDQIIRFAN